MKNGGMKIEDWEMKIEDWEWRNEELIMEDEMHGLCKHDGKIIF